MNHRQALLGLIGTFALSGCSLNSVVVVGETPPTPPTGLYSTTGDGAVFLDWSPNGELNLDHYRVYSSLSPGGRFDYIGSTQAPAYVDL